jgi:hypothetical protein
MLASNTPPCVSVETLGKPQLDGDIIMLTSTTLPAQHVKQPAYMAVACALQPVSTLSRDVIIMLTSTILPAPQKKDQQAWLSGGESMEGEGGSQRR